MKMKLASLLVIAVILVSGCAIKPNKPSVSPSPTPDQPKVQLADLKKFSSVDEIKSFIKNNTVDYYGYEGGFGVKGSVMPLAATTGVAESAADASKTSSVPDYSKTNIQVEGVDEPDIVKTDGKYIYTVSGGKTINIVQTYPPENGRLLATIEVNGTVKEIFVNKDRLIVFGKEDKNTQLVPEVIPEKVVESTPQKIAVPVAGFAAKEMMMPQYYSQKQFVRVYDLVDKEKPVLKKSVELEGNYFDSRMIGNWIYFIVNTRIYGEDTVLPLADQKEVYYMDIPSDSYMLTLVGALNTESEEFTSKIFLIPSTQSIFASLDNIYITHRKFQTYKESLEEDVEVLLSAVPENLGNEIKTIMQGNSTDQEKRVSINHLMVDFHQNRSREQTEEFWNKSGEKRNELSNKREKTAVYKISVKDSEIVLTAKGEVPGRVLNQFSMDEFNGNFRIATTTRHPWDKSPRNHVYVLDGGLKVIGKLEDLAPGESIFSARFIGERAYLVTFKKVDPLFVIDLKDPTNPRVLGKLKIPGFSDYLHPYDQNHIIGIGKEAVESKEGDFAWYQGVKLALFDVSDPENPKELSKFVIGDRGTDSYALKDHKAFLFSKEKNLLVLPVLLAEIKDKTQTTAGFESSDNDKTQITVGDFQYGEYTFQGAYIFELTKEKGFVFKGRITHVADPEIFKKSGYYYYGSGDSVKRSLYIGDFLYTISDKFLKANKLSDLSEVKAIELPYEEGAGLLEKR